VVAGIRAFLTNERFMEVETPMMHVIPVVHLQNHS
jgi:lysyl-tRNA synthetase class 2